MQKKNRIQEKPVEKSDGSHVFDYKDPATFAKFVSDRGRILPRSRSGLTAKEQRMLSQAVKRSRMLALTPFAA